MPIRHSASSDTATKENANFQSAWPVGLAAFAFLAATFLTLGDVLEATGGTLVYSLDDAYIHMAVAKNLASNFIWGLNAGEFSSPASSLLWPVALAGVFKVLSAASATQPVFDAVPLLLNIVSALWVLYLSDRILTVYLGSWPRFAVLLTVVFITPLVSLAFLGMEHVLHLAIALAFVSRVARETRGGDRVNYGMYLAAFLLGAVRYEGLLLAACGAIVLFLSRRRAEAVILAACAAAAPIAYGVMSVTQGAFFLPNSVLLKAPLTGGEEGSLLASAVQGLATFYAHPSFSFVFFGVALAAALSFLRSHRHAIDVVAQVFFLTALLQVFLAGFRNSYRYEAYLVGWGLVALAPFAKEAWSRVRPLPLRTLAVCCVLMAVVAFPFAKRTVFGVTRPAPSAADIYGQQIQLARFVKQSYDGGAVGLNDIGAVAYYTDTFVVDLVGLANADVAGAKLANRFDADVIQHAMDRHGASAAMVYPAWFRGKIPKNWLEVARLTSPHAVVSSNATVSFFATDRPAARDLFDDLMAFAPTLPDGTKVRFLNPRSAYE